MQSTCLTSGARLGVLGSSADLALAAPLSAGSINPTAHTAASRIGLYFDRTPGSEFMGHVVLGTTRLKVTTLGVEVVGTLTLSNQLANRVFAGPSSGFPAAPTFRSLVAGDLPTSTVTPGAYTSANITVDAYGRVTAAANGGAGVTGSGVAGQVTYWAGASALTGDSTFTFDPVTKRLTSSRMYVNQGTITAAATSFLLNTTWNNAAVSFVAFDITVTRTAQAQDSRLMKVGATGFTPVFVVRAGGIKIQPSGSAVLGIDALYQGALYVTLDSENMSMPGGQEHCNVRYGFSHNIQFTSAPLSQYYAFSIPSAPSYSATAPATITEAATVYIGAAPTASTNITLTSSYSLLVRGGVSGFAAGTTTYASINMPHGSAPTSPVDGDVWTTSAGMYVRVNGVTVGPLIQVSGVALTSTYVGFGSAGNALTGSSSLTWNDTNKAFSLTQPNNTTGHSAITLTSTWNNGAVAQALLYASVTDTASSSGSTLIDLNVGGGYVFRVGKTGTTTINPAVSSSGSRDSLVVYGAANTALTATTEFSDIKFSLARTVQWATSTPATQRAIIITAPTYACTGSATITTAATLAIDSAPIAGTNVTITDSWAILSGGRVRFDTGSTTGGNKPQFQVTGTFNTPGNTCLLSQYEITDTSSDDSLSSYIRFLRDGAEVMWLRKFGGMRVIQPALASKNTANLRILELATGAHTLTTGVEWSPFLFNASATVQFNSSGGVRALERFFLVKAPTISFNNAQTVTDTATLAIDGAPVAGTNATLTNSYALWVQSGMSSLAATTIVQPVGSIGLTITGGTQTADNPVISATQTWNGVGVAFRGIKLDVTNTNSHTTDSRLLTLQVASAERFAVDQFGRARLGSSIAAFENTGLSVYSAGVTTGVAQYGILLDHKFSSAATSSATAIYAYLNVDAASFTTSIGYGVYATIASNTGHTYTDAFTFYAENVNANGGTITNAYGFVSNIAAGANRWSFYVRDGGAASRFTSVTIDQPVGSVGLTITGGTQTVSNPVISATQTWNDGAVAFTGISLIVTNSGSSSSSRLMTLRSAGVDRFSVAPNGLAALGVSADTSHLLRVESSGSTATTTGSDQRGILSWLYHDSAGEAASVRAYLYATAATYTTTSGYGFYSFIRSALNQIYTNAYTYFAADFSLNGGTITNGYGFFSNVASAAARWSFFVVASGAPSSFAGIGANRATASTSTGLSVDTFYFTFTGSTAAQTLTLPAANLYGSSRTQILCIRNKASVSVTITRAGADTIDGGTSIVLPAGSSVWLMSDGTSAWDTN